MSRWDDLSPKARWFIENFDELDIAEFAAGHHEGEEPYEDEGAVPTPAQWIWLWNRATPEKRLEKAAQVLSAFERLWAARQALAFHGDRPGWQEAVRAALDGAAE